VDHDFCVEAFVNFYVVLKLILFIPAVLVSFRNRDKYDEYFISQENGLRRELLRKQQKQKGLVQLQSSKASINNNSFFCNYSPIKFVHGRPDSVGMGLTQPLKQIWKVVFR